MKFNGAFWMGMLYIVWMTLNALFCVGEPVAEVPNEVFSWGAVPSMFVFSLWPFVIGLFSTVTWGTGNDIRHFKAGFDEFGHFYITFKRR